MKNNKVDMASNNKNIDARPCNMGLSRIGIIRVFKLSVAIPPTVQHTPPISTQNATNKQN